MFTLAVAVQGPLVTVYKNVYCPQAVTVTSSPTKPEVPGPAICDQVLSKLPPFKHDADALGNNV
mgnify:CR=1 FL=1